MELLVRTLVSRACAELEMLTDGLAVLKRRCEAWRRAWKGLCALCVRQIGQVRSLAIWLDLPKGLTSMIVLVNALAQPSRTVSVCVHPLNTQFFIALLQE